MSARCIDCGHRFEQHGDEGMGPCRCGCPTYEPDYPEPDDDRDPDMDDSATMVGIQEIDEEDYE